MTTTRLLSKGTLGRLLGLAGACVLAVTRVPAVGGDALLAQAAHPDGLFEVRVYNITAGKMDDFTAWMEKVTAWQESVGMEIPGQFASPKQNKYVWIRQYPDEATRVRRFAAVYGSGGMKTFGAPPGYEGGDVFLAHAAKQSKLQFPANFSAMAPKNRPAGGSTIYEFRIYDIKPGAGQQFVAFMGDKMVPWQQQTYKVDVFAQLLPFSRVNGTANGGKVEPEERTYIWGRVFDNDQVQADKYKMYQDPEFKTVGSPAEAGLDKVRTIILTNPTKFSKLQ